MKLNDKQIAALRLAASRRSGLVSCGHRFPTAAATLRALSARGLLVHVATAGAYYDRQIQYRITDAGRAALFACGAWSAAND